MRKFLILSALAVVTLANLGCSSGRCRNLFRRGSPCCGTNLATQPMLRGPIPLGSPFTAPQAPQMIPQGVIAQPGCQCQQAAPMCTQCEPCPTNCVPCDPCESGYIGGSTGYVGEGDCGCQTAPGEFFGGYVEGSAPPPTGTTVVPQGSGGYPGPVQGQ